MLTIFTTPRPFEGQFKHIQWNAIKSWTLLPDCEVILLGDEPGAAEIAGKLNIQHIPHIACNEFGTPLLTGLISTVDRIARHEIIAYTNADVIFDSSLLLAIERAYKHAQRRKRPFLLIGRTYNLAIDQEVNFKLLDWKSDLKRRVVKNGVARGGRDYFVYQRGFWKEIPPLVIGRPAWDNWMVYAALNQGADVIDASNIIFAIHQKHGLLSHISAEYRWYGPEAVKNRELVGKWAASFSTKDANWRMTANIIYPVISRHRFVRMVRRLVRDNPTVFKLISMIRSLATSKRILFKKK